MGCPECGGDQYFRGTPLAELRHYSAQALLCLHKMRQALQALHKPDRASLASALIREMEGLMDETNPGDD